VNVAIIGGAANAAHVLRPDWELWRLGRYADANPGVTRLFELHRPDVYEHWLDKMNATGVPVYVQEAHPGLVNARVMSLSDHVKRWGYVTNSIAAMIAVAIDEGAKNVELHGCPMTDGGIYAHQKPSLLYWIGIAKALDITVGDCSGIVDWEATYG
jgi:hypothetical protein